MKLAKEIQPKAALNYNQHYIGLEILTRKNLNWESYANVVMPASSILPFISSPWSGSLNSINALNFGKQRDVLCELIRQAWELYGKP